MFSFFPKSFPFLHSLALLAVGETVFFLNRVGIAARLQEEASNRLQFYTLVDVAPELARPAVIEGAAREALVDCFVELAGALLRQLEDTKQMEGRLLALEPPEGLFLPSLNGWILEYPVVYCRALQSPTSTRNCLSMQPLRVFDVCIYSHFVNQHYHHRSPFAAFSWSAPLAVVSSAEPAQRLHERIARRVASDTIGEGWEFVIQTRDTTLPTVVL